MVQDGVGASPSWVERHDDETWMRLAAQLAVRLLITQTMYVASDRRRVEGSHRSSGHLGSIGQERRKTVMMTVDDDVMSWR